MPNYDRRIMEIRHILDCACWKRTYLPSMEFILPIGYISGHWMSRMAYWLFCTRMNHRSSKSYENSGLNFERLAFTTTAIHATYTEKKPTCACRVFNNWIWLAQDACAIPIAHYAVAFQPSKVCTCNVCIFVNLSRNNWRKTQSRDGGKLHK